MTPRLMGLPKQLRQFVALPLQQTSPLVFLAPQFQQTRNASILSSLNNSDAYNKRIRRGRGPASGKGKTSGRGHKGQKQHGKVPAGFAGGQTPDIIVHGERGNHDLYDSPFLALFLLEPNGAQTEGIFVGPLYLNHCSQYLPQPVPRLGISQPLPDPRMDRPKTHRSLKTNHSPGTKQVKLHPPLQRRRQGSRRRRLRPKTAHPPRRIPRVRLRD